MDDEDGVELGELGEDLLDALGAEVAVLVAARVRGEALEPEDALVPQGAIWSMLPGTAPPQKPTSTESLPWAASSLASRLLTVVVGGLEFSGMSRMVVMPPARPARVALS